MTKCKLHFLDLYDKRKNNIKCIMSVCHVIPSPSYISWNKLITIYQLLSCKWSLIKFTLYLYIEMLNFFRQYLNWLEATTSCINFGHPVMVINSKFFKAPPERLEKVWLDHMHISIILNSLLILVIILYLSYTKTKILFVWISE